MKCVFTLDKSKVHHVTEDWVSNGHWAIRRDRLVVDRKNPLRRPLMKLVQYPIGRYEPGFLPSYNKPADITAVIPKTLNNYSAATLTRDAKYDDGAIRYVILQSETTTAGIAPEYVPLLSLGTEVLIKDRTSPIVVRQDDEVVAVIMPVRM